MTEHRCETGYHDEPAYTCYTNHGCRCTGCREGQRVYHAKHRDNPDVRARDRLHNQAYETAESRLRERHRDEFERLYLQEKAKRGLIDGAEVSS